VPNTAPTIVMTSNNATTTAIAVFVRRAEIIELFATAVRHATKPVTDTRCGARGNCKSECVTTSDNRKDCGDDYSSSGDNSVKSTMRLHWHGNTVPLTRSEW